MRGQENIKLCDAEQTKQVYHYKNAKLKLYKNNAAISSSLARQSLVDLGVLKEFCPFISIEGGVLPSLNP